MFKNFMKKYGYYIMAFVLILVIGLVAGLNGERLPQEQVEQEQTEQTGAETVSMISPLSSPEVIKWFSDTELFYNQTLNQWESHKGVDLKSENAEVYAVLDGVVTNCSYNFQDGYCVTIKHDNNLSSVYCSLADLDGVVEGAKVKRGDKIGEASTSSNNEAGEGGHLHFEVLLNDEKVDPANYIAFENK